MRAMRPSLRQDRPVGLVPCSDLHQQRDRDQRSDREPRDTLLSHRQHDERGQQRPQSAARVSAHLKKRLRQPMLSARSHSRHARRFGMKHRRSDPHQRDRQQHCRKSRRVRNQNQSCERKSHPQRQRIRHGTPIGIASHHRLKQRRGELRRQRDQSDLPEIQMIGRLQNRIYRGDHRLQHVVQQMAHAECRQDSERNTLLRVNWIESSAGQGFLSVYPGHFRYCSNHFAVRSITSRLWSDSWNMWPSPG